MAKMEKRTLQRIGVPICNNDHPVSLNSYGVHDGTELFDASENNDNAEQTEFERRAHGEVLDEEEEDQTRCCYGKALKNLTILG